MAQLFPILTHAENCLLCQAKKPGWFCDLPPDALAEYDAMGTPLTLPKGSKLFTEGEASRGVSVLCAGEVKLTKSSRNGKTLVVRVAKPGDVLGLSAALSKTPYEVTAEALEPSQVKLFRRDEFLHFLQGHVEGSLNAAESLNQEYRAALTDACRLALSSSIAGRMAHLLLELANDAGTQNDANPQFRLTLKHEDIASMLGSSRESVTRVLSNLKRKGIISVKGTRATILRKAALEALI